MLFYSYDFSGIYIQYICLFVFIFYESILICTRQKKIHFIKKFKNCYKVINSCKPNLRRGIITILLFS